MVIFMPLPEEDTRSIHHFTSHPSPKQNQVKPSSIYDPSCNIIKQLGISRTRSETTHFQTGCIKFGISIHFDPLPLLHGSIVPACPSCIIVILQTIFHKSPRRLPNSDLDTLPCEPTDVSLGAESIYQPLEQYPLHTSPREHNDYLDDDDLLPLTFSPSSLPLHLLSLSESGHQPSIKNPSAYSPPPF